MVVKLDFIAELLQASDLRQSKDREERGFPRNPSGSSQTKVVQPLVVNIQNVYGNMYAPAGNFNNYSPEADIPVRQNRKPEKQNFSVLSRLPSIAFEIIVKLIRFWLL